MKKFALKSILIAATCGISSLASAVEVDDFQDIFRRVSYTAADFSNSFTGRVNIDHWHLGHDRGYRNCAIITPMIDFDEAAVVSHIDVKVEAQIRYTGWDSREIPLVSFVFDYRDESGEFQRKYNSIEASALDGQDEPDDPTYHSRSWRTFRLDPLVIEDSIEGMGLRICGIARHTEIRISKVEASLMRE